MSQPHSIQPVITQFGDDRLIRTQQVGLSLWARYKGEQMLHRRAFLTGAVTALAVASAPTAFAADSPWDGTWSGKSSGPGGRMTTVKISKGKVTAWTNNGFPRPKVIGSVSGKRVTLDDQNGWKATIVMQGEGKARITASGIGNNGKPARNSANLVRR